MGSEKSVWSKVSIDAESTSELDDLIPVAGSRPVCYQAWDLVVWGFGHLDSLASSH